jgi:hypothetical protein
MQNYILALAMCGSLLASGCQHGLLQKRQSELNCPTDIRKTVPWCAGEDAVFRCPCGPSSQFYGHKPTCWGHWPATGSQWRDSYCGCSVEYPTEEILSEPVPLSEPLPDSVTPQFEGGNRLPAVPQPAEQQAEPLFVPPQPTTSRQHQPMQNARLQSYRTSLEERSRLPQRRGNMGNKMKSEGIQQVSHTEEISLEPHAWTGIKFVR